MYKHMNRGTIMNINAIENTYTNTVATTKTESGKSASSKNTDKTKTDDKAAVYEKSEDSKTGTTDSSTKKIYSMSSSDRASIVEQLKNEQQARQQQLVDLVKKMITKQGGTFASASGDDMWKFLASGNYKVDSATQAQAQKDIAVDGYWGVDQTSERIFSFASALAGDDEESMRKMQKAFEKGFRQATGAWGKDLPDISNQTYKAVQKKFDDYFESKKTIKE